MPSRGAAQPSGFVRLWLGQSVSMAGSQVTVVALPLTAVLTLHAGPYQMGLLRVASTAPFLLFGLLAGAWVDRRSRLSVLVVSNLGQALLLAAIPALAIAHRLQIDLLYAVAFLVGVLTVLFDVAYQAFVPSLVDVNELPGANSRLETSRSVAQVVGPGLGGLVVQLVSAPFALLVDVASFLFAAVVMRTIRDPGPERRPDGSAPLVREVWEGLVALLGQPVLRAISIATTLMNLCVAVLLPILVLFMVRTLHLTPALIGVAVSVNGLAGVAGALGGGGAAGRLPTAVIGGLGVAMAGVATLLMAAATGPPALVVAMILAGQATFGFAIPFYNVNQLSLRQALTPPHLQARVHATSRTLTWGVIPIGAYLGGQLGELVGLRQTLVISAAGSLTAAVVAYVGLRLATRE
jgi:predicted MFS family arabinose efflux permease